METPKTATAGRAKTKTRRNARNRQTKKDQPMDEAELERDAARRFKIRQHVRQYRARRKITETPEERAARRAIAAEKTRERRQKMLLNETPEQVALRRKKTATQIRKYRQKKKAKETPEQAAVRLARFAALKRRRRAYLAEKEPEVRAGQLLRRAEKIRQNRLRRRALEPPEVTAARKPKVSRQMIKGIRELLATFGTSESEAERYHDIIEPILKQSKTKELEAVQTITGETVVAKKAKPTETTTKESPTLEELPTPEILPAEVPMNIIELPKEEILEGSQHSEDSIQTLESLHESFLAEEHLQTQENIQSHANTENKDPQLLPDSRCLAKDDFQNKISNFESLETYTGSDGITEKSHDNETVLKDAVHCMTMMLHTSKKRDQHLVYGEHVAHKFRTCNRDTSELIFARQLIENVLSDLTAGVYSTANKTA